MLQSRRKIFAIAYRLDKNIATFFGRPPRIPARYSNVKLPFDLDDSVLLDPETSLESVAANLDEDGWSRDRAIRPSSWIRVRFIMSKFREEILELSLGPASADIVQRVE